jgi:hypothetical protein
MLADGRAGIGEKGQRNDLLVRKLTLRLITRAAVVSRIFRLNSQTMVSLSQVISSKALPI